MSYQINYVPQFDKKYPRKLRKRISFRRQLLILAAFVALVTGIVIRPLRDWLFPGDPEVTNTATQKMVESLRSGEGIEEAISAFCIEVLKNGTQN